MEKYNRNQAFRSKRFVSEDEEEHSASFCGLDQEQKRQQMDKESKRLRRNLDDEEDYFQSDFKSRYTKVKRQTTKNDERERTCCYIYIRVDPTLWDVVYKNEGLNVSRDDGSIEAQLTFFVSIRKKNQPFMLLSLFSIERSQQPTPFIVH